VRRRPEPPRPGAARRARALARRRAAGAGPRTRAISAASLPGGCQVVDVIPVRSLFLAARGRRCVVWLAQICLGAGPDISGTPVLTTRLRPLICEFFLNDVQFAGAVHQKTGILASH
jgi:hypothetical protein